MANLKAYSERAIRQNRYFSEDFKCKRVKEIETCVITIADICREYQISRSAIYKWIYKFSLMRKKSVKIVVEAKSDTAKIKALHDHIRELERLVGQKQFEIDFLSKQIEIASSQYGVDLKKKLTGQGLFGSGKISKSTGTK